MSVPYFVEEMNFVFFEEEADGDGVDGSVPPAFVEELVRKPRLVRAIYPNHANKPTPPHLSR